MGRYLLIPVLLVVAATGNCAEQKLRGMWVDVFHEGIKSPTQVGQLIERAKRANINALFIQVRSRAQVYHTSIFEPRAPDTTPLFDGLQEIIRLAHAQTPPIQVHAWINAHPLWDSKTTPPWPDHVVLRHPDWFTRNPQGGTSTEVGRALDFGNPEAAEYLLRLYLEVVRNYNVDGLHLDFIRYTGNEWGYNAESVRRFYASLTPEQRKQVQARTRAAAQKAVKAAPKQEKEIFPGAAPSEAKAGANLPAPTDPLFSDWRRAQVTNFVKRLAYHAKALRPDLILSAAVIPWGDAPKGGDFTTSAAYSRCFQDWKGWAQQGLLDLLIPMLYFRETQHAEYFRNWVAFCQTIDSKTPIAAGIGNWLNSHADTLKQTNFANSRLAGVCYFSYASTNPYPGKEAELFNETFYSRLGEIPWSDPMTANIHGEFSEPKNFGYDLSGDELQFYVEPRNSGTALNQKNRYHSFLSTPYYRSANDSAEWLIDQVVQKHTGSELLVADAHGEHTCAVLLSRTPDVPFTVGDVVAVRGLRKGGQLVEAQPQWLGIASLSFKRS